MFKKMLVLVAACGVSLSASAGYVQYDLALQFGDGQSLTGMFVQNTANSAIAFYDLQSLSNRYMANGDFSPDGNVSSARITVPGGPTSFNVWSAHNGQNLSRLVLNFGQGPAGSFTVSGYESITLLHAPGTESMHGISGGSVVLGQVAPSLLALLETGSIGWTEFVPPPLPPVARVPEPASLVLIGLGACAMGSLRRRAARAAA